MQPLHGIIVKAKSIWSLSFPVAMTPEYVDGINLKQLKYIVDRLAKAVS